MRRFIRSTAVTSPNRLVTPMSSTSGSADPLAPARAPTLDEAEEVGLLISGVREAVNGRSSGADGRSTASL